MMVGMKGLENVSDKGPGGGGGLWMMSWKERLSLGCGAFSFA